MDDDEQIKKDNDFEDDEKDAKDMHGDVFLNQERIAGCGKFDGKLLP